MKIEKNKLMRVPYSEKHNENVFELRRSDVILDSVRVYLIREFKISKEIDFTVYCRSEPRYKIVLGKMLGEKESVSVTYEYLRQDTVLTINKDEYSYSCEVDDGSIEFYLKDGTDMIKE